MSSRPWALVCAAESLGQSGPVSQGRAVRPSDAPDGDEPKRKPRPAGRDPRRCDECGALLLYRPQVHTWLEGDTVRRARLCPACRHRIDEAADRAAKARKVLNRSKKGKS